MKKISILVLLFSFVGLAGYSQFEFGAEFQHNFSKSGSNIASGSFESFSLKRSFTAGVSYNFSSGKNNGGVGFFVGTRYSFGNTMKASMTGNIMAGGRLAYNVNQGSLSATIETGYHAIFNIHGFATPSLGLGYTFDLDKDGDDESKAPWLFTRVAAGYRF